MVRKNKLIKPRLQLKIAFAFVLLAGIAGMVQAMFLVRALSTLAGQAGDEQGLLMAQVSGVVQEHFVLGFLVLAPLFLIFGILVTFRIAGPVYRMELYLKELAAGGYSGPCSIRKGDELQELCEVLNQAVGRLRVSESEETAGSPDLDGPQTALPTEPDTSRSAA